MKKILVTGATGYVGGRLITELVSRGYRVRVLARGAERLSGHSWKDKVEIIDGDAHAKEVLERALEGIDVAYYLLHALMSASNFEEEEERIARLFGDIAREKKVSRIIYLGGLAPAHQRLSPHLQSRVETGAILLSSGVPTIELRAGVVIGSGSASFEMLRYLTERLPAMVTPRWVDTKIQPIAIRDVLHYLAGAAEVESSISGSFDVGGPDIFTYREMMQEYAKAAGLRRRLIIPVPVLTPTLSAGWVGFVTPVPVTLAKRLVESLKNEVICRNDDIRKVIPDPEGGLTPFSRAVSLALTKIKEADVPTRWSDAQTPGAPSQSLPTDPEWSGGSMYRDVRRESRDVTIESAWRIIESIGGKNGYYAATWIWHLRGFLDRVIGGVGLRRGRRDPDKLHVGEALDFWRVEKVSAPVLLRLRAEMKLPGLAWLEFSLQTENGKTTLVQQATFAPRGLFGHIYWWVIAPFHEFIFPKMAREIMKRAER